MKAAKDRGGTGVVAWGDIGCFCFRGGGEAASGVLCDFGTQPSGLWMAHRDVDRCLGAGAAGSSESDDECGGGADAGVGLARGAGAVQSEIELISILCSVRLCAPVMRHAPRGPRLRPSRGSCRPHCARRSCR